MENLITATELTNYAPDLDTSSFSTATISGMIGRASKMVQEYCNVAGFLSTAVTGEKDRAKINPAGELVISFKRRPVSEGNVTAIALKQVDVDVDLELTDGNGNNIYHITDDRLLYYPSTFVILHGSGLFALRNSNLFYEISYTGGYDGVDNVPADIKEAVTLMVRHLAQRKNNSLGAQSFSQGSYSVNFGTNKDGKDVFVKEAQAILDEGGHVRRVLD